MTDPTYWYAIRTDTGNIIDWFGDRLNALAECHAWRLSGFIPGDENVWIVGADDEGVPVEGADFRLVDAPPPVVITSGHRWLCDD